MVTMTDTNMPELKLHKADDNGLAAADPDGTDDPMTDSPAHEPAEPEDTTAAEAAEPVDEAMPADPHQDDAEDERAARAIVEAVLFATEVPLKPSKIAEVAGLKGARQAKKFINQLNKGYEQTGAAFRIEEIAEGFQMLTLPQYNEWLSKLLAVRQESRLSQAGLETLAIVAYKQPVLRADVEAIRGVSCGDMLNRLREANLIKIVGRAEDVGRPILYGTTKQFLEVFGLGSLEDLPQVEELMPPE